MPDPPTYPGVYTEETPSGAHAITGVSTSITAFIGRALGGPVNEPTIVLSFVEFEQLFGGLWQSSTMSYAVQDFFLNGGKEAVIVRIVNGATPAVVTLPAGSDSLILEAVTVGSGGNSLRAAVDYETNNPADTNVFNLSVFELSRSDERIVVREEILPNLSIDPESPRYVPHVLEHRSKLLRMPGPLGGHWNVCDDRPDVTESSNSAGGGPAIFRPLMAATGGSDGSELTTNDYLGSVDEMTGLHALEKTDLFNLLCIPPPSRFADTDSSVYQAAMQFCYDRRAMLIVDPPLAWGDSPETAVTEARTGLGALGLSGLASRNVAFYFPRLRISDTLDNTLVDTFVPCGSVAGIIARTDHTLGVWKAPAGVHATLNGVHGLQVNLTDPEHGILNPIGINCLRSIPSGYRVWGARTLVSSDQSSDEYRYLSVRRTALYVEESVFRGTQWVVFEPNDEPLWAQIRLSIGTFMHKVFQQGAFQGNTPVKAYFVKCDRETTTQHDIDLGIVNILVGFAPLKPAEFVIIRIQQQAGQIEA